MPQLSITAFTKAVPAAGKKRRASEIDGYDSEEIEVASVRARSPLRNIVPSQAQNKRMRVLDCVLIKTDKREDYQSTPKTLNVLPVRHVGTVRSTAASAKPVHRSKRSGRAFSDYETSDDELLVPTARPKAKPLAAKKVVIDDSDFESEESSIDEDSSNDGEPDVSLDGDFHKPKATARRKSGPSMGNATDKPRPTKQVTVNAKRASEGVASKPMMDLLSRGLGSVKGLDLSLPPLHAIDDIFRDMIKKAMECGFGDFLEYLNGQPLHVATMCSGTESPFLACNLFSKVVKEYSDLGFEINHAFSAEIVPFKQAYIERNFKPPLIFRDITELIDAFEDDVPMATTAYGAKAVVPTDVHILIAGTSCVDFSNLNKHQKTLSDDGESAKTWQAVLAYCKASKPPIVILENVKTAPWERMLKEFAEIGYETAGVHVDTKDYYLPHTRQRGYMVCFDKQRMEKAGLSSLGSKWQTHMSQFRRYASSPVSDFLLPTDFVTAKEQNLADERRREVDWARCAESHVAYRQEKRLGNACPLTNWQESGAPDVPENGSSFWFNNQVERVWDLLDCCVLRKARFDQYDWRYKLRIVDVSQNVYMREDTGAFGIIGCITPSGANFLSDACRAMSAEENLTLQGVPISEISLTTETSREVQDLAGNAMSTTVVGSAILSALLAGYKLITEFPGPDTPSLLRTSHTTKITSTQAATKEVWTGQEDPTVANLLEIATRATRKCVCERSNALTKNDLQQCVDCGHTACTSCGGNPKHNYRHDQRLSKGRLTPQDAEAMLRSKLPLQVRFDGHVDAIAPFHDSLRDITGLARYPQLIEEAASQVFSIKTFRRSNYLSISYQSQSGQGHLELVLKDQSAEWQLFAHAPSALAGNDPLRTVLQQPVAIASITNSLFGDTWRLRTPSTTRVSVTIRGHDGEVPTWWSRLELPEYRQHSQPRCLTVAIPNAEQRMSASLPIEGSYVYFPQCGTACESLYKKVDDEDAQMPMFLFLDPTRVGLPNEDCFVFSRNPERLDYDERRPVVATIEASWRPWNHGQDQKTVSIMLDSEWIDITNGIRLQPLTTTVHVREPLNDEEIVETHDCNRAVELVTCGAAKGFLSSVDSFTAVDTDDNGLLSQSSWLLEAMRRRLSDNRWRHFELANTQGRCVSCAPREPELRWKLGDDKVSIQPYEDSSSATEYERAIKNRSPALIVEAAYADDEHHDVSQLRVGVNLTSMAHRVQARLPDGAENISFNWRLNTTCNPVNSFNFRPYKLKPIEQLEPYKGDLDIEIDLFPNQRLSLAWMKQQEAGKGRLYSIEEAEEERLPNPDWRLEMRAQAPVYVRGGICADKPGYGKTITTLALVKSQFQDHSENSVLNDIEEHCQSVVPGLIASVATLVICPGTLVDQWAEEACTKFGFKMNTDVLLLKAMKDFDKKTVDQMSRAKLVIATSAIFSSELYTERLAALAGVPGPASAKGRAYDQWLDYATTRVPKHVGIMAASDRNALQKHVKEEYAKNIHSEEFKAVVPSRRLRGKDYAAAQKTKSKSKIDMTKAAAAPSLDTATVGIPLLHYFFFERMVCDEFHDLEERQLAIIKSIKRRKTWGLSGTPAIGDSYEVAKIGELLGVPLRIGSDARGVLKLKSIREYNKHLTNFEIFENKRRTPSASILERIHQHQQIFLDTFVTRNLPDFPIDFSEHLIPVALDLDHRALYTEISQHLNSIEMRLKRGSKSKTTDRETRLYYALASSDDAEQALSKAAAFFERDDQVGSASNGLAALMKQRHEETVLYKEALRAATREAEKFESIGFEKWRQGRVHFDDIGDRETFKTISGFFTNSQQKSLQIAATKFEEGEKEDRSQGLTSKVNGLVQRLLVSVRSLRYLQSIDKIHENAKSDDSEAMCANDECTPSAVGSEVAVSAHCGHIVCLDCYERMKEKSDTQCPAIECKATIKDHQLLWKSKMGDLQNTNQSTHGAKLAAAIELLRAVEKKGDQAILFVQYENQLSEVSEALKESGIAATTLNHATAASSRLEEFKSPESKTTVIVLNASDETATGLNLQNANHVIFLSPLLRDQQYSYEATMAQAIGRVRRHGQQKEIHVYRIVALDTIDVDILEHRERRTSAIVQYGSSDIVPPSPMMQGHVGEPKPERAQLVCENGVYSLRPQSWLVKCGADEDDEEMDKIRNADRSNRVLHEQRVKMKGRMLGWQGFSSLIKFSRAYTEDDE